MPMSLDRRCRRSTPGAREPDQLRDAAPAESNGGILALTGNAGGPFTNDGGTIESLDGSKVSMDSNATLTNDSRRADGRLLRESTANGATLSFERRRRHSDRRLHHCRAIRPGVHDYFWRHGA